MKPNPYNTLAGVITKICAFKDKIIFSNKLKSFAITSAKFLVHYSIIYVLTILPVLTLASTSVFIPNVSYAVDLPITPDGTTNTQIDHGANGVPIVNIAAPNSSGLSHNRFTDYNVNARGLIINNSIGNANDVIQTNLGGLITNNRNLVGFGSATTILNEVTSNNKSYLNGYTEIAGPRADLIIANPNGIQFNGAGFINISRLTTVVGSSCLGTNCNYQSSELTPDNLTFSLIGNKNIDNDFLPKLIISGLGVDITRVDQTDFVASVMQIVSPIYGGDKEVNLKAGDKEFNYKTKEVTSDNTGGSNASPCLGGASGCAQAQSEGGSQTTQIAIDASNLAKIQAGKIYIVATKEGFGVKYSADMLASKNGVTIDANGNVSYNNIAAENGNIEVKSRNGSVTASGVTQAKGINNDVKLEATNDITNEGQIVSNQNIEINAGNVFNNNASPCLGGASGCAQAQSEGGSLSNSVDDEGDLITNLANNDFIINAKEVNNNSILASNGNLTINSTNKLNNAGILSAVNDLNLTSNLIISNQIIANNNININADQITSDDIIAGNDLNINATTSLTNNNNILSLSTDATKNTLIINTKTLNNNKRIAANSNIQINANYLNNNTSNSLILSGRNTQLNITNLNNNDGTIDVSDILTIQNLTTNNPTIANSLQINDTNTIITNNDNSTLKAINGININLNNNDYTINGKLQTNGFINIEANNITNLGKIEAKYLINIVAKNNFTNGGNGNPNNANIKIASNKDLYITANSNIDNYATLSAKSQLFLISINGDITNHQGGEFIASNSASPKSSLLLLQAKNGTINQFSQNSVIVDGDHIINSYNYTNTGRIDIAGTLIMNIDNDLINDTGALIYAGEDMYLNVVHNLTNKEFAQIYAENNLIIQKYDSSNSNYNAADNKINKLENISGSIETYQGDIIIEAKDLINTRTSFATQDPEYLAYKYKIDGTLWHELTIYDYSGTNGAEANISSGKNLTLNLDNLTNDGSAITSKNNMNLIVTNDIINQSHYVFSGSREYYLGKHGYIVNATNGWRNYGCCEWNFNSEKYTYTGQLYANATIKSGGSITILQNGSLKNILINGENIENSKSQNIDDYTQVQNVSQNIFTTVNGIDINTLLETGKVEYTSDTSQTAGNLNDDSKTNANLVNYLNGPTNQGLFTKNPNPNGPLFETRSQFIDQSKFFGSNYFYERIGLNLTDVQTSFEQQNRRLFGDQFFQTKLMEEQLKTISKNSFLLSPSEVNINNEIQTLLNNAVTEYYRLGLTLNQPLTQEQINSLNLDIIWFEVATIDGQDYIIPKLYLSKATRERLKNANTTNNPSNTNLAIKSTIFSNGSININSHSLSNNGSIISNNSINITNNQNITNENFSQIIAQNSLTLNSTNGDITNRSLLKADTIILNATNGDITNTATVKTNAKNLLDSNNPAYISNNLPARDTGNIDSKLIEQGNIQSNNLLINAGNDFNNYGANINTTNDAIFLAGDDINIDTVQLRNRDEYHSKKVTMIHDETTNIGSNIAIGGNLLLQTTGLGTDDEMVTAQNNYQTALDQYNKDLIKYNEDRAKYEATLEDAKFGKISKMLTPPTPPIEPNFADFTGDIGSNVNITRSDVTSNNGDINVNSNNNIFIQNATNSEFDQLHIIKRNTFTRTEITKTDYVETAVESNLSAQNINLNGDNIIMISSNLNSTNDTNLISNNTIIAEANLLEYHDYAKNRSFRGVASVVATVGSAVLDVVGFATSMWRAMIRTVVPEVGNAIDDVLFGNNLYNKSIKTNADNYQNHVSASNIESGNNFNSNSQNSTTISASNILANNININADRLIIQNGQETNYNSFEEKTKRTLTFKNYNENSQETTIINSQFSAQNDINFNIENEADLSYSKDNAITNEEDLKYLDKLEELKDQNDFLFTQSLRENESMSTHDALRGLTGAGTAVVIIVVIAATIASAGALAPAGAAVGAVAGTAAAGMSTAAATALTVGTAMASTAYSTIAVSAINAGMNVDGSAFDQLSDVTKTAWDDVTSDESIRNIIISGAAAWAGSYLNSVIFPTQTTTAASNGINGGSTAANGINGGSTLASNASSAPTWYTSAGKELAKSAITNTSNIAAQSIVNGDSFTESLQNQWQNIIIMAVAQVGAQEIGNLYHGGDIKINPETGLPEITAGSISKSTQLLLHAGLGCTMAAAGGNDCISGAASGVIGEIAGEMLYGKTRVNADGSIIYTRTGLDKNTAEQIAGLIGGSSAIITGDALGLDDQEIADNIFSGARIAENAAQNNAMLNIGGALIGGVAGAGGAAWGAYVGGADTKGIFISAGVGGTAGAISGFLLNPAGVWVAIVEGTAAGAITGGISAGGVTYFTNPDISGIQLANNTLEGIIGGGVTGFTSAVFTPIGGGIPGAIIGAQTALPFDMFMGNMSAKYDLLKISK